MKNWSLLIIIISFSLSAVAQDNSRLQSYANNETVAVQKIKVFPNPATNVVNILGLKNSAKANIVISDINGNIVLQHQWSIRNKSISIPIPNLNSGIYVVRIESVEQKIQTKFLKK